MHQLDRIEMKLDTLLGTSKVDVSKIENIFSSIYYGNKIDAIKELRLLTGLPLIQSKNMIERYFFRNKD